MIAKGDRVSSLHFWMNGDFKLRIVCVWWDGICRWKAKRDYYQLRGDGGSWLLEWYSNEEWCLNWCLSCRINRQTTSLQVLVGLGFLARQADEMDLIRGSDYDCKSVKRETLIIVRIFLTFLIVSRSLRGMRGEKIFVIIPWGWVDILCI